MLRMSCLCLFATSAFPPVSNPGAGCGQGPDVKPVTGCLPCQPASDLPRIQFRISSESVKHACGGAGRGRNPLQLNQASLKRRAADPFARLCRGAGEPPVAFRVGPVVR